MKKSLLQNLIDSLGRASQYNSNLLVKPAVVLWPDPERQWESLVPILQKQLPALLVLGPYDAAKWQGPAIWIKCMVEKTLPAATWPDGTVPVIYLPGVSKADLKNNNKPRADITPLVEYLYTGTLWVRETGKEWTVSAFLQNPKEGLGLNLAQNQATKEATIKSLTIIAHETDIVYGAYVDADFFHGLLLPDATASVLHWICKGDAYLQQMPPHQQQMFKQICQSRYGFLPDHRNVIPIVQMLGEQKNAFRQVWQLYATAPAKFPELEEFLRQAKPDDLGVGMFKKPEESWPQVNEAKEEQLRKSLKQVAAKDLPKLLPELKALKAEHSMRLQWVWAELGKAPLAKALPYLVELAETVGLPIPANSLDDLKQYYVDKGYRADQAVRKLWALLKTQKDKAAVQSVLAVLYQPWLENLAIKFQSLATKAENTFLVSPPEFEEDNCILFVDALRWELAQDLIKEFETLKLQAKLSTRWTALPSLTPTCKPVVAPIAPKISTNSAFNEFCPQLPSGENLQTAVFRKTLTAQGFTYVENANQIEPTQRSWKEIGDIDSKGHEEGANMFRRVEELFGQVVEFVQEALERGVNRIHIVTDHGWLMLPGGLPKATLPKDHTETRWGRCALIKEGIKSDLLHLPWRWNPGIFVAYAPGISFFKANEEYAHGGLSIQECLTPEITLERSGNTAQQAKIENIKWVNLKCTVFTQGAPDGYLLDMRTKFSDASTSIVESTNKAIKDGKGTLMVNDQYEGNSVMVVLLDRSEKILHKFSTVVGGD